MLRPLILCALGLLAGLPVAADPLPQGDFMLGEVMWADGLLPRYATLVVDCAQLQVELSSAIPMNFEVCETTGACVYAVEVATANADVENGTLSLTGISIDAAVVVDDGLPGSAREVYTQPLMAALNGAGFEETPFGFVLNGARGPLDFYRADSMARDAIRVWPITLDLSINALDGCEVRSLAPLLEREDATGGTAQFIRALSGFAIADDLYAELRAIRPPMFENNRPAFDAALAHFGESLGPMVGFLRHMQSVEAVTAGAVCADPSLGFIAAYES